MDSEDGNDEAALDPLRAHEPISMEKAALLTPHSESSIQNLKQSVGECNFRFVLLIVTSIFLLSDVLALIFILLPSSSSPSATLDDVSSVHVQHSSRAFAESIETSYELVAQGSAWKNISGVLCFVLDVSKDPVLKMQFNNDLKEQTLIHLHGLNPPSALDGVPFLSSQPLSPLSSRLRQFNLRNQMFGTFFMHSHLAYQSGQGAVAPLVIAGLTPRQYPLANQLDHAQEVVMIFQDFCPHSFFNHESPHQFQKKHCNTSAVFQSFFKKSKNPNMMKSESCFQADHLDVAFSALLCNNRTINSSIKQRINPKIPIRIRIINAASMTNFYLRSSSQLTLVATDGNLVEPFPLTRTWIGVGQRLDFILDWNNVDSSMVSLTGIGEGSRLIGKLKHSHLHQQAAAFFLYDDTEEHFTKDDVHSLLTLTEADAPGMMGNNIDMKLTAFTPLQNYAYEPDKVFHLNLTGHHGFNAINGQSLRLYPFATSLPFVNPEPLRVQYGDRVHIELVSHTMHPHAMHLHGHRFQIIAIDGKQVNGPIRDTVIVPGCHSVVIAFDADNPGQWAFHCHMEIHLAAGMFTTVEYSS